MRRRSFLAALAAIPVVGKLVQAEAPHPPSATAELAALNPGPSRFEVVYDRERDNPFGGVMQFRGIGARAENEYLPQHIARHFNRIYPPSFVVYTLHGPHTIPDFAQVQRVTVDHSNQTVLATYRPRRGAPGVEYTKAVPVDQ